MANATENQIYNPYGQGGRKINLPVAASTTLYEGVLVAQLVASGALCPMNTALSGPAVGVATQGAANTGAAAAVRCLIEYDKVYSFANSATGGEECSEALLMFSPVFAADDHTISKHSNAGAYQLAGLYCGMDEDGKVRVFVGPQAIAIAGGGVVGILAAQVSNDFILAAGEVMHGATYDVGTTGAASTVTLPATPADGTRIYFVADGTKNGHTVQYRDATGPTNLTTALLASKRHLVVCVGLGGKWFANAYVSP